METSTANIVINKSLECEAELGQCQEYKLLTSLQLMMIQTIVSDVVAECIQQRRCWVHQECFTGLALDVSTAAGHWTVILVTVVKMVRSTARTATKKSLEHCQDNPDPEQDPEPSQELPQEPE